MEEASEKVPRTVYGRMLSESVRPVVNRDNKIVSVPFNALQTVVSLFPRVAMTKEEETVKARNRQSLILETMLIEESISDQGE